MKIALHGTKEFKDYNIFMRAMGVALSDVEDEFIVYSAGPLAVNNFASEFVNKVENSLKARDIKSGYFFVPSSRIIESIEEFDYVVYFSLPKQPVSSIVKAAEQAGITVGIFRY